MEEPQFIKEISIPQAKALLPHGIFCNDDIFLAEDILGKNLPTNEKDIKCVTIIFCEKGRIRYEVNGHTVFAEENNVIINTIGQHVNHYKVLTPYFQAKVILVNSDSISFLTEDFSNNLTSRRKFDIIEAIKFTEQEMYNTKVFFSQIIDFLTKPAYNRKFNLAISLIRTIVQMALDKRISVEEYEKDKQIFYDFIDLVELNVLGRLSVSTYCKQLGISRTTLGKLVYKYKGKKPKEYINERLLNRICILAECTSSQQMPIKKIAEHTNFRDTADLSRFFFKMTKKSLSEYRKLEPEMQHRIIHHTIFDQTAALADLPKTYIQECQAPPPS